MLDSKKNMKNNIKKKTTTKKQCIGPQREHTKENFSRCTVNRSEKIILTGLLKENTVNNAKSDVEIFQLNFFII